MTWLGPCGIAAQHRTLPGKQVAIFRLSAAMVPRRHIATEARRYWNATRSVRLSVEALGFKGSFAAFALF